MKKIQKTLAMAAGLGLAVAALSLFPAGRQALAQDATIAAEVYMDHGGNQLNVKSGGLLKVYSGGTIDVSAGTLTLASHQIANAALASIGHAALASDVASLSPVSGGNMSASGTTVTVAAGSAVILGTKTKAQLQAYTPGAVGELWQCSDCSADAVVVATGTTVQGVGRLTAKTTAIQ